MVTLEGTVDHMTDRMLHVNKDTIKSTQHWIMIAEQQALGSEHWVWQK